MTRRWERVCREGQDLLRRTGPGLLPALALLLVLAGKIDQASPIVYG
jgi:hypothetical protein